MLYPALHCVKCMCPIQTTKDTNHWEQELSRFLLRSHFWVVAPLWHLTIRHKLEALFFGHARFVHCITMAIYVCAARTCQWKQAVSICCFHWAICKTSQASPPMEKGCLTSIPPSGIEKTWRKRQTQFYLENKESQSGNPQTYFGLNRLKISCGHT